MILYALMMCMVGVRPIFNRTAVDFPAAVLFLWYIIGDQYKLDGGISSESY